MSNMKKDTIEAKGLSIQVYTEDFNNAFILVQNALIS